MLDILHSISKNAKIYSAFNFRTAVSMQCKNLIALISKEKTNYTATRRLTNFVLLLL